MNQASKFITPKHLIQSNDTGHNETTNGAKTVSGFAWGNLFTLILQWSKGGTVLEQEIAFSLVVFSFICGNLTLIFVVFFQLINRTCF